MAVRNAAGTVHDAGHQVDRRRCSGEYHDRREQRDAYRESAGESAGGVSDLHLHLRDHPGKTGNAFPLKKFIFWALSPAGQKLGVKLRYVPIPKHVLVAAEKTLKQVHS